MKEKPSGEPIALLLVDDEEGFVNVLAKRMARRDIKVTGVLTGTEALQVLRKKDFDIAVLDLKLGDMDGIEVLKIIKKMAPNIPVIMLTGHGSEQAAEEGLKYGAMDYLTKPCDLGELIAKINKAIPDGR